MLTSQTKTTCCFIAHQWCKQPFRKYGFPIKTSMPDRTASNQYKLAMEAQMWVRLCLLTHWEMPQTLQNLHNRPHHHIHHCSLHFLSRPRTPCAPHQAWSLGFPKKKGKDKKSTNIRSVFISIKRRHVYITHRAKSDTSKSSDSVYWNKQMIIICYKNNDTV